jgi:hypothetical protein
VRGFLLGLSVSLAFIGGVLSSGWLVPQAAADDGAEGWVAPTAGDVPSAKAPRAHSGATSAASEAPPLVRPMPRWEYICYRAELTHKLVDVANQAGEEGWEMVGTDGQGARPSVWCFKRRKDAVLSP